MIKIYNHSHLKLDKYRDYVVGHYGEPPELRGILLMRVEESQEHDPHSLQEDIYYSSCGKDVIYVRTRCGGDEYEKSVEWEKSNIDFIISLNDEENFNYRDHYLRAVVDEEYLSLLVLSEDEILP